MKKIVLFLFLFSAVVPFLLRAQEPAESADSTKESRSKPAVTAIKPYKDVITVKAVSFHGMFDVHKIDEKYYFEIPRAMLGREVLLVVRSVKTGGGAGYGSESLAEIMFRWDRSDNNRKIYLRKPYVYTVADRQSDIYPSFRNSYVEPIFQAFDIKAFGRDSSAVIDVTEMFAKDNFTFGLAASKKSEFRLGAQEDDKSFVLYMKAFPGNIECRTQKTYKRTGGDKLANTASDYVTFEINHSMLLLPEKPMMPRYGDDRVGFFTQSQTDFSYDYFRIKQTSYVRRWNLQPKDPEAFRRGELVEPVKPIVFYIDPATPEKLVPYFKRGIEAWQVAFEQAGFKNAILAREAPSKEENPDWDAMDARYSMVSYLASEEQNAYGPHVADPRSGEILEAHVCIYHNLMTLVSNWYRIQTAGSNSEARVLQLSDERMGELYEQVVTHEVGHSLGLAHNFASSHAIPVDSLRSRTYTDRYGTSMSIMDYARYNYVAQPGDGVRTYIPRIGPYDKYVIGWGYRPIPDARSPKDELPELDRWITEKAGNPVFLYIKHGLTQIDPRGQSEDLGDDPVKAGQYGLKNLQFVMANFDKWIYEPYETYEPVKAFYEEILAQWKRYMRHATTCIGGQYETYKHQSQQGICYQPVEKAKQKEALRFVCENAFDFPEWLVRKDLIARFDASGVYERNLRTAASTVLGETVSLAALFRMMEHKYNDPQAYGPDELLRDVTAFLYRNMYKGQTMTIMERSLQRTYLEKLSKITPQITDDERRAAGMGVLNMSDLQSVAWGELELLRAEIGKNLSRYPKGGIERSSLEIQQVFIDKALLQSKSNK